MIWFLGITFLALFIYVIFHTMSIRQRALKDMKQELMSLHTACAGSDNGSILIPVTKEVSSLKYASFRDSKGNILDSNAYTQFIVQGESMQFCGIHNDDLIFVDSTFDINLNKNFPVALVLKKKNSDSTRSQFKIRRTWKVCQFTTSAALQGELKEILDSQKFKKIKELPIYDGDNELINDVVEKRLPEFENKNCGSISAIRIIISTTYHTDCRKIRFSLHPVEHIVGKVVASFPYRNK